MAFQDLLKNLPEVENPKVKLGFNVKLKWTLMGLVIFHLSF